LLRHGIAMSLRKLEAVRHYQTYNIGKWMSAKIYADARANKCSCGGSFNAKSSLEGIDFPICSSCGGTPAKYRIRARVIDENNRIKNIDIRHDRQGRRLTSTRFCLGIIDTVREEEEAGKFDVKNYSSVKKKDKYLFKNFLVEYQEFHRKRYERKEITENGYNIKIRYSNLLLPFFGHIDIAKISVPMIKNYYNSFTENFSNRRLSMGELKTILNHALEMEKITKVPKFEVESSGRRKTVPNTVNTREKVIPAIKDIGKREAIRMIDDYGLRPCEIRAIQYEQLSFFNKRIKIDRHFSNRKMTTGRKSIKAGEKMAILDRPWTPSLEEYINSKNWSGDPKEFLFTTSRGTALGPGDMSEAWREAEKIAGVPHSEMYGIRGAKITEILETKGVLKAKNFAGHTNASMTLSRYDHSSENVDDVFSEEIG
jgi:integrase